MLAAKHDQENFVHAQQQAGAAKPLNQGLRNARTPGNKAPKTPFKVPLNDENLISKGKTILRTNGKGNENVLQTNKKDGKAKQDALVTPAAPRTARAPLGMKTTNAKGTAIQTPGLKTNGPKSAIKTSPRLRRAKVKVLPEEQPKPNDDDNEPDIEYMPPKATPLPDHREPDLDFSILQAPNLAHAIFASTTTDPLSQQHTARKEAAAHAKARAASELQLQASIDAEDEETLNAVRRDVGLSPLPSTRKPQSSSPSTIQSKSAASALSQAPAHRKTPSFAAPTAAAKAHQRTTSTTTTRKPIAPHSAAAALSKSSLGYSAGRAISSHLRKPSVLGGSSLSGSTLTAGSGHKRSVSNPAFLAGSDKSGSRAGMSTIVPAKTQEGMGKTGQKKKLSVWEEELWKEEERLDREAEEIMRRGRVDSDEEDEEFEFTMPEGFRDP